MRPSHLHLSVASGAVAPAKLLLPLLMAQLWGEAGDRGHWESDLSAPTPRAAFAPLGPRRSPPAWSRPRPSRLRPAHATPTPRLAPPTPRPFLLRLVSHVPPHSGFSPLPLCPARCVSPTPAPHVLPSHAVPSVPAPADPPAARARQPLPCRALPVLIPSFAQPHRRCSPETTQARTPRRLAPRARAARSPGRCPSSMACRSSARVSWWTRAGCSRRRTAETSRGSPGGATGAVEGGGGEGRDAI